MHNILSLCRTCRRSPTGPRASPEMPRWRRRSRPKLKCLRPVVSTDPVTPALNKYSTNSGRTTTIHNHIIWSNTVNIRVYIYLTILYIYVCIYIYTNIDAHEINNNNNCSSLIRNKNKNKKHYKHHLRIIQAKDSPNIWTSERFAGLFLYYISIITNSIF